MRRWLVGLLLLVVVAVGALVLGAQALLNSAAVRERMAAALERATGHGVTLGRVELAWSATPAVAVRDVVLLNPPGFQGTEFARVGRAEARLGLWGLLAGRIEVPEAAVRGAVVRLERNAAGRGNWLPPAAPVVAPGPASAARERRAVAVGRVVVDDARVEWWGGPAVQIPLLAVSPAGGPVEGRVVFREVGFTVAGQTGPGGAAELTAVGGGLAVAASGKAGGEWTLRAQAADLAGLQALAGRPLPAVRDVVATAAFGPGGLGPFRLTAGAGEPVPGFRLTRLEGAAEGLEQPLQLAAEGVWRALPVSTTLNLGSARAVLSGAGVPFQALVLADGGRVAAQGTAGPSGVEAAVTAELPDLARTGALAGMALPAARDVAASVQVLPAASGAGLRLRGLRVTAAQGDVAGDLAVGLGPVPSVAGTLVAGRLDLDALLAVATPVPPQAAPGPTPGPGAAAPGAPAPGAADTRLVPAGPVPFAALRAAEADLRVAAGVVTWRGAAWRAAEARLVLRGGKLRVDPAQVLAPGGAVTALVTADAAAGSAGVMLRGAGLDAGAMSGNEVSGTLDVDVRVESVGADWRTLAAGATGHVGVALSEGDVENRMLSVLFGPVMRAANIAVDMQGRSRVRCLALRTEAAGGVVRLTAVGLDSSRLRLEGEGAMNLADETLDLRLRPTLRIGPASVAVPLRVTGPMRAPRPELERGAISPGRVGISILGGGGGGSADPCPGALAAARAP